MRKPTNKLAAVENEFLEKIVNNGGGHFSRIQQEIIHLYFIKKISQQDIAQQKNMSPAKIRNELTKALFKFRRLVNDREYLKANSILYPDLKRSRE
jgi:DNA-directed RNA polymerase specialized sigma subunit